MKRIVCLIVALALMLTLCFSMTAFSASAASKIDNSDLTPKWRPSSEVDVIQVGDIWSPDWIKELIMAEVRIETATPEGTFQAAVKMLDHYEEMGVNGLWVTPIYDRNSTHNFDGNGYGNYGPETVWSVLTGTKDYEEGWKVVKNFVDEAHKRNIRIFFDVVVWGTAKTAPVYAEHPEYFTPGHEVWGGYAFGWGRQTFKDWFVDACADVILKTGADGFRCDLEPTITGYGMFQRLRDKLYYDYQTTIAIFSEGENVRKADYDFEQGSIHGNHFINASKGIYPVFNQDHWEEVKGEPKSLVDIIKSGDGIGDPAGKGAFQYYTYNLLCHDDFSRIAKGNLITFGWQCLFTPFIPMWYIGEEWNNPRKGMGGTGVLYFDYIDWTAIDKPENREYFEMIKKYIRIRRTYPEIFQYFPADHRETNICAVKVGGVLTDLQAYARYMDETAVLIVPNDDTSDVNARVTIPYAEMGMGKKANAVYTVTDLLTGKEIAKGTASELTKFSAKIKSEELGVYLVQGPKAATPTTTKKPNTTKPTTPTTTVVTDPTTSSTDSTTSVTDPTTSVTEPTEPTQPDQSEVETLADGAPIGLIVGIAAGVVVVVAAVIVLLALKKKKA